MTHETPTHVGNLTLSQTISRKFGTNSRFARRLLLLVVCLLLGLPAKYASSDDRWQAHQEIRGAAESYLSELVGDGQTSVVAGQLDPRHKMANCDQALQPFLRRGTKIGARTIVGVRCNGTKPWKVYLPVDVVSNRQVMIASRTLPRGHLIAATDLTADIRDVSGLTAGYLENAQQLVGQRLKHQIISGRIITPSMLLANNIVHRGQSVTLLAKSGGLQIKMNGKALTDGALGQRIRVENASSGRIVEGLVRSAEFVEIVVSTPLISPHATAKVSANAADTNK